MNITCIAIDDEYLALQVLREYCKKLPTVSLVREFTSPNDALDFLSQNTIDAILLDIQMPFLNGFNVLEKLTKPPMVIFTTAHHDYAVKAYELNVLDYLVKPIPFERFKSAIVKASSFKSSMNVLENRGQPHSDSLFFRADHQLQRVDFKQVDYLEGLGEYVKVHTSTKTYITLGPMKELTRQLPAEEFIQIHKSFIIRLSAISSSTHQHVTIGKNVLPIGRVYKEQLLLKLLKIRG